MRALDAAILMAGAAVVARAHQGVVFQQRGVAGGEVLLLLQVLEGRRQAVAAMLTRGAAGLPQRVLQPAGERLEALAAVHHLGVLPAREGEHEVIQPMGKRHAGQRDREVSRVGEVGQPLPAGGMVLGEEHLLGRAGGGAPLAQASLQRAQHGIGKGLGMVLLQLMQDGNRLQARLVLQPRTDLAVPDGDKRIGARAPVAAGLLRGQRRLTVEAACRARAQAGLGGSHLLGVGLTVSHI